MCPRFLAGYSLVVGRGPGHPAGCTRTAPLVPRGPWWPTIAPLAVHHADSIIGRPGSEQDHRDYQWTASHARCQPMQQSDGRQLRTVRVHGIIPSVPRPSAIMSWVARASTWLGVDAADLSSGALPSGRTPLPRATAASTSAGQGSFVCGSAPKRECMHVRRTYKRSGVEQRSTWKALQCDPPAVWPPPHPH